MKYLLTLLTLVGFSALSAQKIDIKKELPSSNILYVITLDNETIEVPYQENILIDLEPEMIEEIKVIKRSATPEFEPYKFKQVEGVIMLTLKDDAKSRQIFEEVKKVAAIEIVKIDKEDADREVQVRINGNKEANVLYQIEIENKKFTLDTNLIFINEIRPEDIKNISVLKDSKSLELFGADGKDGIIMITLKKNKTTKKLREKLEELENKDKN